MAINMAIGQKTEYIVRFNTYISISNEGNSSTDIAEDTIRVILEDQIDINQFLEEYFAGSEINLNEINEIFQESFYVFIYLIDKGQVVNVLKFYTDENDDNSISKYINKNFQDFNGNIESKTFTYINQWEALPKLNSTNFVIP